ncbi:aspartyl/asparaginyl beta-hydroxylase domain-containing protein [Idiomarina aminovorans]|uniref:aspartyl/asparaginyl beta-hydroxylase domain-containing protein n=1 Tax=Idiomarina aminovorans TaxID=2914829 RepID=UPI00200305E4|nr:aspartyl/asparaginyl beta-hydroxylase domain-containing protein [Idiomarina sp. ATCH4]MCK7459855.1 aspartyl/asparaginyl beta-hydroxylase domain-containing protein [Idiomarina sp. ATCH4]
MAETVLVVVTLLVVLSLKYVYSWRGNERFDSVREYMRKGWPIFAPLNCLLYALTKPFARRSFVDAERIADLKVIKDNWETIREEAIGLYTQGEFDKTTDKSNAAYYDVGFRTFYKYGWSKFYLKWYGSNHASAKRLCPKTTEILAPLKSINGAMFSLLPAGSQLTRHLDPVACSLRYHLGLSTPNTNSCFINVDGEDCYWRDGEHFLFDETYLHFARNDSDTDRLILMCDVERPMFLFGGGINWLYKHVMKMAVVPNTTEDKPGIANRIFATVAPLLERSKALKKTNRRKYKFVKWSVNLSLMSAMFFLGWGTVELIEWRISDN